MLVQRIEIGKEVIKTAFRVTVDAGGSGPESIVVAFITGVKEKLPTYAETLISESPGDWAQRRQGKNL